jgi:hypothetical protein
MIIAIALTAAVLGTHSSPKLPVQPDSGCLHQSGGETQPQRERSVAALSAARAINTAQSQFAVRNNRTYAHRAELAGYLDGARYDLAEGAEIVPGFSLTLDTSEKGYWFLIKDKTDPCGFSYISNQDGLIFVAQPIR